MDDISVLVWGNLALSVALKSVLLLGLTAVLVVVLRKRAAATRHWIWAAAMASVLVLPVFSVVLPKWQPRQPALVDLTSYLGPLIWLEPAPGRASSIEFDRTPATAEGSGGGPASLAKGPERRSSWSLGAARPGHLDWLRWALGGWAAGAALGLLWLAAGIWASRRILSRAPAVVDPSWRASLRWTRTKMGWGRRVRLLESSRFQTPVALGIVWPTILVPRAAADWPASRQRVVLAHELAHLRRRDNLTQLLAGCACCLFWFNPLAWVAYFHMRLLREFAADDEALRAGMTAPQYGQELVAVIRQVRKARVGLAGPAAWCAMKHRLKALLDHNRRRRVLRLRSASVLGAVAAGLTAYVGLTGVDPALVYAVAEEEGARYVRAPLAERGADCEAAEHYRVAMGLAERLRFYDEKEQAGWGPYLKSPAAWREAPGELKELAAKSAGQIVAHLSRGASCLDGTSPWHGAIVAGNVDTPKMGALKAMKAAKASALRHAASGRVDRAFRETLVLLWFGQDLRRGSALIGANMGGIVEEQALDLLLALGEAGPLRAVQRQDDVARALDRLSADRVTLVDALWSEAMFRAIHHPAFADLASTEMLIRDLRDNPDLSPVESARLVLRYHPVLARGFIGDGMWVRLFERDRRQRAKLERAQAFFRH